MRFFRGRRLAELLREVVSSLRGHDIVLYAAGLTFYATIAVVPLLLIAVWAAALVLGKDVVAGLGNELAEFLPSQLGVSEGLRQLTSQAPRLSLVSLLAALVPATTYGEGLARTMDRLAGRPKGHKGLAGRLKALVVVGGLPLLVLVGLFAVAVLPDVLGLGVGARLVGIYATFWVGWISASFLLAVIYRTFTQGAIGPWPLFWGSACAGSFLAGMSLGWVQFLALNLSVGQAYGGSVMIATGVLAALYLFLVQLVLLVGYVLTLKLAARAREHAPGSPGPAGAVAAASSVAK